MLKELNLGQTPVHHISSVHTHSVHRPFPAAHSNRGQWWEDVAIRPLICG